MLTELKCRAAKPKAIAYKLADEKGLYLYVSTSGHRSWRMKYRFGGKEKLLTFGPYPEVTLSAARDMRDEARALLRGHIDPRAKRLADELAARGSSETVETVARRWYENQKHMWKSKHAKIVIDSLEKDIFPARSRQQLWDGKFGDLSINLVRPAHVREILKSIHERGATETAHRIGGRMQAFFGLAIAEELIETDPAAAMARVLPPIKRGRMPALTNLAQARSFLRAVESAPSHPITKLASRLLAITAVRPGVIRFTPREGEFEGLGTEAALWKIPAERMKLELERSEHEAFDFWVPLPRQAVDVIQAAQTFGPKFTDSGAWLFPGWRNMRRPISENALNYMYKRITEFRGRHVPHGWRSTFSSVMNELAADRGRLGDEDVIELMLAHKPKGVRGIYNRAAYLQRRREIAQEWADMLLEGFPPAEELLEGARH